MKVTARKCPVTGRLFDNLEKYRGHLIAVRRSRNNNRQLNQATLLADQAITWATQNVASADEFENWFRDNWSVLATRGIGRSGLWSNKRKIVIPQLAGVRMKINFSPMASNTHSCPQGGVTNWRRHHNMPRGYPGWEGNLSWRHDSANQCSGLGSDIFRDTVIHTGTGGGAGDGYQYSVTLWADDWPAWNRQHTWDILANR